MSRLHHVGISLTRPLKSYARVRRGRGAQRGCKGILYENNILDAFRFCDWSLWRLSFESPVLWGGKLTGYFSPTASNFFKRLEFGEHSAHQGWVNL